MKKLLPLLLGATAVFSHSALAQTATTTPVGAMTFTIAAGNGVGGKVTSLAIPLLDAATASGQLTGRITGVTTKTISNSSAGWTAGQLSAAAEPYLVRITSGVANGRTFLVSTKVAEANTSTTLTVDSSDLVNTPDLTTLGIVVGATTGDTYQIIPCDTLATFFSSLLPSQGVVDGKVLGGSTSKGCDNVVVYYNGGASTYFYKTDATPPRWTKVTLGSPDASNTPLRPDTGINYSRVGNTPLTFTLLGTVPDTDQKVSVKNSGITYLAQAWPTDRTISQLGLQNLGSWTSNAAVANADKIQIWINNAPATFWFDGTNWKKQTLGSPISNTQTIPAGSNILVNKLGTQQGYTVLNETKPY